MKRNTWKWILASTLLVGSLDIFAALAHFYIRTKKDPLIVPKYIASAVFGGRAYTGDNMILYGFLFHFVVALGWTFIFYMIYPKMKWLSKSRVMTGLIYGIFIWLLMTQLVVPLTRASTGAFDPEQAAIAVLILVVTIGLPLSFLAYRHYRVKTKKKYY